jgi:CDP-glycerol glycerophosphotransferase
MKNIIKTIIKSNKIVYKVYVSIFNTLFNALKLFIKVDKNIILINSFGGRKYDDSPKIIYEYMKKNDKYKKYDIYFAFEEPKNFNIEAKKLKVNSFEYFIVALKAKYWITNSSIER